MAERTEAAAWRTTEIAAVFGLTARMVAATFYVLMNAAMIDRSMRASARGGRLYEYYITDKGRDFASWPLENLQRALLYEKGRGPNE